VNTYTLLQGHCLDVLKTLPEESVQTCITSPPYFGLRDYGCGGQIGLESTPEQFVQSLVDVFAEVHRVLKKDGTLWLNLGDSYVSKPTGSLGNHTGAKHGFTENHKHQAAGFVRPDKTGFGLPEKNLIGIPWRVAFALQSYGWYLRQDIIWHKPNPMPESVTDRCTKAHEYIFLLSKSERYFYDIDSIREPHIHANDHRNDGKRHTYSDSAKYNQVDPVRQRTKTDCVSFHPNGKNKRSVWSVTTKPYKGAHFAVYPTELIRPCVLAGSRAGDVVLDPFNGSGTTGFVSVEERRKYIGIDINPEYLALADARIKSAQVQEVMEFDTATK